MRTAHIAAVAALLALSAPWAQAQSTATSTSTSGTQGTPAPSGSFASLSPGGQTIARSLFEAQQPTAAGPAPLNLDQIAAMRAGAGWGRIFQQMKARGLVNAKNLGQLVSAYHHAAPALPTTSGPVVVTTAEGQALAIGSAHHSARDAKVAPAGGHHDIAGVTTVSGGSHAGATLASMHGGGGPHLGGTRGRP